MWLNMNWTCAAKKTNSILRFIKRNVSADWENILPLCALLVRPTILEYCVQFWALQYKIDIDIAERVQGHKDGEGIRAPFLCLAQEKKYSEKILSTYISSWKESGKKIELLPEVPSNRTRGSGHQLKHARFPLNIRKHFFTMKVIITGTGCPEILQSFNSLRFPKMSGHGTGQASLSDSGWAGQLNQMIRGSCQHQSFCDAAILWIGTKYYYAVAQFYGIVHMLSFVLILICSSQSNMQSFPICLWRKWKLVSQ